MVSAEILLHCDCSLSKFKCDRGYVGKTGSVSTDPLPLFGSPAWYDALRLGLAASDSASCWVRCAEFRGKPGGRAGGGPGGQAGGGPGGRAVPAWGLAGGGARGTKGGTLTNSAKETSMGIPERGNLGASGSIGGGFWYSDSVHLFHAWNISFTTVPSINFAGYTILAFRFSDRALQKSPHNFPLADRISAG